MSLIKIINPGLLTTVQDRGRFKYQKWGVPVAGAMDDYALRVANMLVGNHENEASLEITLLGPVIEFTAPGLVALTGADLGARLNGRICDPWQSFEVHPGDVLQFSGIRYGCRAYLAAAGGLNTPVVMGSRSTYLRGRIGGLEGRALREGDELGTNRPTRPFRPAAAAVPTGYRQEPRYPEVVHVVLGPQQEAFTRRGVETFLNHVYVVTHESDRMGCRLDGPVIEHREGPDIISDGIAMGSIQVPGSGTPIVMMADRQTTGGYAKLATVITPDLWKMAQAKPGDGIYFKAVTMEQAHREYIAYEKRLQRLPQLLAGQNSFQ